MKENSVGRDVNVFIIGISGNWLNWSFLFGSVLSV